MSKSLNITIPITTDITRRKIATALGQVQESLRDVGNGTFDHGWKGVILDGEGRTIGHYAVQGAERSGGPHMSEVMVTLATPRGRDIETMCVTVGSGDQVYDTSAGMVTVKIEEHMSIYCCPRCAVDTPLMATFEFKYNELYCQVCGYMCGMFGQTRRVTSTRKLRVKKAALRMEYEAARKLRESAQK